MYRDLTPYPLADAMKAITGGQPHALVMTMGQEQWDGLLSAAYEKGWILLELDADEHPVRAYRRATLESRGNGS